MKKEFFKNNRLISGILNFISIKKNVADILLIQCPPWDINVPPLGVAYLSSYLKKHNYKSLIFDLNINLYWAAKESQKYLWEQKSYDYWADDNLFQETWVKLKGSAARHIKKILCSSDTEFIGLSVNYASIRFAAEILKIIRSIDRNKKIILGGWGCINEHMRSLFPKELVDVFVVGEGEETLKDVIRALRGIIDKSEVRGAIFLGEGNNSFSPREPIMDLDSIPWPTFEEFNLKKYKSRDSLAIFSSRGCISNCIFCNDSPISKPYRFRRANSVFEEIKYHYEANKTREFSFKDLLCNGNIEQLSILCDLIINSGLKISWNSQAIPRKEMSYDLLRKLKESGCAILIYGVESFSNNVLKKMNKIFTANIAERVIKDSYRAGVKVFINIIVGFPGETEEDFQQTYEAINRLKPYIAEIGAISVCLINHGSALENNSGKYGLVLSADTAIRAKKWISADGANNYEVRRARAQKIINLVKSLNLKYQTITV